jgi:hypothetical protein
MFTYCAKQLTIEFSTGWVSITRATWPGIQDAASGWNHFDPGIWTFCSLLRSPYA